MTAAKPGSLPEALAALQAAMPRVGKHQTADVKNKEGRKLYDYSFAAGEDITPVLYPVMAPLGLSFTAAPTMRDGRFVLEYALLHTSGEQRGPYWYPLPDPDKYGPQELGKAETYARRYSLTAITGLFPGGEDNDARSDKSEPLPATARPRTGTNASLRAEGRMDRRQKAEHEQLEADTKRPSGRRGERVRPRGPDPDDPWAQDAPVDHHRAAELRETLSGPDLTEPEDKPGSILPAQVGAIGRVLGLMGIKDQEDRHDVIMLILDLKVMPHDLETGEPSTKGLSYAQAATALTELNHRWSQQAAKQRAHA